VPVPRRALLLLVCACSTRSQPDAPTTAWRLATTLPAPRLEAGVTAVGDQLIVLGGFDAPQGASITKRVDVYDTLSDMWSQLPDAPVAWTHVQLAAVGSTVYLLGGLDGPQYTARGDSFALDISTSSPVWTPLPAMPLGMERGSAAVVVAPPRIYLLGGASTTGAIASVVYFDIEMNHWCPGAPTCQAIPDLPQPRSHPVAMRRFDGSIIVAGGLATLTSDSQSGDTWLLPPSLDVWQTRASMLIPRGGCAAGVLQGQLVCAGGEAGTSALNLVESYDPLGDVWTTAEMMPVPRAGTQGVAIGQRLWVPGGAARLAFEPTDTVYVYAPLDTSR
jgi:N-acetylneuraminic acid mutarotase